MEPYHTTWKKTTTQLFHGTKQFTSFMDHHLPIATSLHKQKKNASKPNSNLNQNSNFLNHKPQFQHQIRQNWLGFIKKRKKNYTQESFSVKAFGLVGGDKNYCIVSPKNMERSLDNRHQSHAQTLIYIYIYTLHRRRGLQAC